MAERTVPTPAERLESGRPVRVWYGIAGAPAAWVLQSSLDWFVESRACADGDPSWGAVSAAGVRLILLALAAAAIGAGLVALLGSLRAWRETSGHAALSEAYAHGTAEYLSVAGLLISAVFLLAMVWTALPAVLLPICEGAR